MTSVRRSLVALTLVAGMLAACESSRSPAPIAPTATPTPAATPADSATPGGSVSPIAVGPTPSPEEMWAFMDEKLAEGDPASGPEFEIDAEANAYFNPVPVLVYFKAKPLNGSPPFKFVWDLGDGSPPVEGDRVAHIYREPGQVTATVKATDGSGEKSHVTLILGFVTPKQYVEKYGIDPRYADVLEATNYEGGEYPSPAPSRSPEP
jgi:hypothetical protein